MSAERSTDIHEWMEADPGDDAVLTGVDKALAHRLIALGQADHPDPKFAERLTAELVEVERRIQQAETVEFERQGGFLQSVQHTWQWVVRLAGLVLLVGFLVFSMNLLPRSAGAPGPMQPSHTRPIATPTTVSPTARPTPQTYIVQPGDTWNSIAATFGMSVQELKRLNNVSEEIDLVVGQELQVSPTGQGLRPTDAPTALFTPTRLLTEICGLPAGDVLDQEWLPPYYRERVKTLAGGGSVENGNFTFGLWLACDPSFSNKDQGGDSYSEIDGLGLVSLWRYHGPDMDGAITEHSGFEPYVREGGSSGPVSNNPTGFLLKGIQFPLEVIPDFSQADIRLRYVLKVRTPDNVLSGAALSFVLHRLPNGFLPSEIQVDPLSAAELQIAESEPASKPSFPVKDPLQLYPQLKEVRQLLDRFNAPLSSAPGWVHVVTRREDPQGNGLYGNLTEWIVDSWYQIDARGYVIAYLYTEHTDEGRVLQQSYAGKGQGTNLTFGTTSSFSPYPFDLGGDVYNSVLRSLKSGKTIQKSAGTVNGQLAWVYKFGDSFSAPVEIGGVPTTAIRQQEAINQETGARLFSEMVRTSASGEEQLIWRLTYEHIERLTEPPEQVLSVFGQAFQGYNPPVSEGTPAPQGFDASQRELTLRSIPGDSFEHPSFFYGDIYAGNYLLGRVDFGASPGGFCDRSADGSKLAFSYQVVSNESEGHEYLHWFDLQDVSQVYNPVPELELISKVSWAPHSDRLAFTACKAGRTSCGLYLLSTGNQQVGLLTTAGVGSVSPVWKPDESQIAFIGSEDQDLYTLFVVDTSTGATVYSGPFDAAAWKSAADAPVNDWGVSLSRGYEGTRCFVNP